MTQVRFTSRVMRWSRRTESERMSEKQESRRLRIGLRS